MAGNADVWNRLFSTTIDSALPLVRWFYGPREQGRFTWVTSDATLRKADAINWKLKQFAVADTQTLLGPFQRRCVNNLTIQHPDLAIGLYCVVAWDELEFWGDVFLMCMCNENAAAWAQKGKSAVGISREMIGIASISAPYSELSLLGRRYALTTITVPIS